MFLSFKNVFNFLFPPFPDVEEVIEVAKRKLEKERELFMSRSLPGFAPDGGQAAIENELDSDSDSDESEEKGII